MKKENKDQSIRVRLTSSEKDKILEYCERHNMSVSEFIRFACNKIFDREG